MLLVDRTAARAPTRPRRVARDAPRRSRDAARTVGVHEATRLMPNDDREPPGAPSGATKRRARCATTTARRRAHRRGATGCADEAGRHDGTLLECKSASEDDMIGVVYVDRYERHGTPSYSVFPVEQCVELPVWAIGENRPDGDSFG